MSMNLRWLNSFTVLSVILLAIAIVGAFLGQRMVFDPGSPTNGREWIIYLVAGLLMLVNGLIPSSGPEREDEPKAERE